MTDDHGRKIEYLRLSVTDLCNLRCIYCMSGDGVIKRSHSDILSIEELAEIARAAYALGIRKIRLTGGEPLVRRGILDLCRYIKAIDPEIELSMTTNGVLLDRMAAELKCAGVDRLNISLDSLDSDRYRAVTRLGELSDVMRGIDAAQRAGFTGTKLNCVLLGGINDREIHDFITLTRDTDICVRFIELMPIGVAADWPRERFISRSVVEAMLGGAQAERLDGVARIYRLPGHKGTVGLITPMSNSFCSTCNRVRVTADGKLKPCLHSSLELPLRGLSGDGLISAMSEGIKQKPSAHRLGEYPGGGDRCMNEIGG